MTLSKNITYAPKEALALDGVVPVKAGKGRISLAADARCRELAAQGYRIKGYETTNTATAKVEVKKVVSTNEKIISDFVILYPRDMYKAVAADGKVYGMAECCNNCRVSLVQNHCDNPTILGDIAVKIVPR